MEIKYNYFLTSMDYFTLNSIENKIMYFKELNKSIYSHNCLLSKPRLIKSSNNNIISKILDIDNNITCKIIKL